MTSNDLD